MVLRDGDEGLEVLMLRRNLDSVFVPGAHVFPGGAVEPSDEAPIPTASGPDEGAVAEAGGVAHWVAGIRETFEEAGLVFGDGPVENLLPHRHAVATGEASFAELCRVEGIRLRLGDLHYFGHWITPAGAPRRYTTRFFVAPAPLDQAHGHDEVETVDSEWVRPTDALARQAEGAWELILPTERSLRALAQFDTADAVLTHAATRPPLHPDHGGRRIALPVHQELTP
jgi:8-oxo-dGTP pyrophosphatase MutT (NUDIX family)